MFIKHNFFKITYILITFQAACERLISCTAVWKFSSAAFKLSELVIYRSCISQQPLPLHLHFWQNDSTLFLQAFEHQSPLDMPSTSIWQVYVLSEQGLISTTVHRSSAPVLSVSIYILGGAYKYCPPESTRTLL